MYTLKKCILELTTKCNLRCLHCASSCGEPADDELTTQELLDVVDDLAKLKPDIVTLSGGEPLLRDDWHIIAKRLSDSGMNVSIVTNGSFVDKDTIDKFIECNVTHVSISIDGTEEIHNSVRGNDSYKYCKNAIGMLNSSNAGFRVSVITTLLNKNIGSLTEIRDELIGMGVKHWQIQPGLLEGNLALNAEENNLDSISPSEIMNLIDFAYEENKKGDIFVYLPDTVGYNTKKEAIGRQLAFGTNEIPMWCGCCAGIMAVGVLSNGDVIGCTSIRKKEFVEGNVRDRSLSNIWNDENAFAWRRNLTPDKLEGRCKTCQFVESCLGGCTNTRLTTKGSIYSENEYCAYLVRCLSD